jgi:mRNA-degrading endonuclease toxin of MazEF toxin-antitoxin module
MKVRRGEAVLVDFRYSAHTGSRVRPALVVQADARNQHLDDTILGLITSSRHRRVGAATQLSIDITTAEG